MTGWGTPWPGLDGGGVPPTMTGRNIPLARSGWWGVPWSTPYHDWMGHPLVRSGWWGVLPTMTGWGISQARSGLWVEGTPTHHDWMRYPSWPGLDGGGYPPTMTEWVSPTMTGWGTPSPHPPTSIASTCYAAGDMPLAFMQEDFLVITADVID